MALADIIKRIEDEAAAEAAGILDVARTRAARTIDSAEKSAAEKAAQTVATARQLAEREAARTVVAARLEVRDKGLARRRELVARALGETATALASLPSKTYVALLAAQLAVAAKGGESVSFGADDVAIADDVLESAEAIRPGLALSVSTEPAPFARGLLVSGDRVRSELSLDAIVASRRDELELTIASALFAEEA